MKTHIESIVKNFLMVILFFGFFASLTLAQESNQPLSKSNLKIFIDYNLAKAKLLTNDNIKVQIEGNKIILSGTVPTVYAKKQAGIEASSVDENYSVVNNLTVTSENIADNTLSNEILNKIHSNAFYGIFDWISVESNNGVVTLDGWVHLPWLKSQFKDEVEKIPGVKSVINKIQNTFGPGEIGYRAARLIYNDPMFWGTQYSTNPPIHIIVNNGSVYLYGTVDSQVQKDWAGNIISFRTDAFSVENNLQVK